MFYLAKNLEIFKYFLQDIKKYCTVKHLNETRQTLIEEKRKEIMARGLPKKKPIKGVKHILLVASGKGGVGKSTVASNLSIALKCIDSNKSVGLLDTDIFGPSIPLIMNVNKQPVVNAENLMEPLISYGIKCMSMGFLIDKNSPVIWRGLMVMNALEKLLYHVAWDSVDYLIIDTPPGTSDTHLSLIQNLFISGVLLVTTPQKGAIEVTRRGANMFKKLNIPIAGIVENMSIVTCPICSSKFYPFHKYTKELADELEVEILQEIPVNDNIIKSHDADVPIIQSIPESKGAIAYKELANSIIKFLETQPVHEK